jgi:hypothetical protein
VLDPRRRPDHVAGADLALGFSGLLQSGPVKTSLWPTWSTSSPVIPRHARLLNQVTGGGDGGDDSRPAVRAEPPSDVLGDGLGRALGEVEEKLSTLAEDPPQEAGHREPSTTASRSEQPSRRRSLIFPRSRMSFCAQIPKSATRPMIEDTLTVSLITRRPRIAPASIVGTLMRTRNAQVAEPTGVVLP